jgi:hypothetical protein
MLPPILFKLLWVRMEREIRLGFAADYCPVCRSLECFEVSERRMALHCCFIPVERGDALESTQTCKRCRVTRESYPSKFNALSPSSRGPLDSLIRTTLPSAHERYKDELELAGKIAAGGEGIDEKTRAKLLMEVFNMARPHFRSGFGHEGRRILGLGLRPLRPTDEEIIGCLNRFRDTGCRMGARLRNEEAIVLVYPEREVKNPKEYSY